MLIMKANEVHYFSYLFDKVLYMFYWCLLADTNRTTMTNTYCVYSVEILQMIFKWFIPVVCDCNIKYQKDIGWIHQNTTLYYGVGCP